MFSVENMRRNMGVTARDPQLTRQVWKKSSIFPFLTHKAMNMQVKKDVGRIFAEGLFLNTSIVMCMSVVRLWWSMEVLKKAIHSFIRCICEYYTSTLVSFVFRLVCFVLLRLKYLWDAGQRMNFHRACRHDDCPIYLIFYQWDEKKWRQDEAE